MDISEYLTVAQAAEFIGITQGRVRQILRSKELIGVKMGKTWLIHTEQARKYKEDLPTTGRPRGGNPY